MIVSVATCIHKIKHGGKPIPTFHPPFQWSPYILFVYNKQEVKGCNYYYNVITHTQNSYLTRIECFHFFPGLVHPCLLLKVYVPLTKLHSGFASVSTSLISMWCANYHRFIRAKFPPRLLLFVRCTSFLRLVWIRNKFRCSLHAHKLTQELN